MPWEETIPYDLGALPWAPGYHLHRTNLGGNPNARIAILGVYPAVTSTKLWQDNDGVKRKLPVEFEKETFQPDSASGREIVASYLQPLNLNREQVCFFDMMPYFFANVTTGKSGRSMWDNVQHYCQIHNVQPLIRPRPRPDDLLKECREMRGNEERISEYLNPAARRLLITLGNEAAAYVLGETHAQDAQNRLYSPARQLNLFGQSIQTVHLAHPGLLMKKKDWADKHAQWCTTTGQNLINSIISG